MLNQQRLKELLSYDIETGIFTNLTQRAQCVKKGADAGGKHPEGYIYIQIDGKQYNAHRLAWLYIYGELPKYPLDHINEIKDDNRISNLRLDINNENLHNKSNPQINNTSGFRGVHWSKKCQKWAAQISIKGKVKHLGLFNTAEEAYEAYLRAKREHHTYWVEK